MRKALLRIGVKAVVIFLCLSLTAQAAAVYLKKFTFDEEDALDKWGKMVLNGEVDYALMKYGHDGFVRAFSKKACSALYHNIRFRLEDYPVLKWKWRVSKFPDISKAKTGKDRDDYAARVYVIFPFLTFSFSKFLEYVWADDMPVGTVINSPYGKNVKIIVIRSGPAPEAGWVNESRNIYEDYKMAFGRTPTRRAGAIAIMCDADSTKTVAESFFDSIEISKEDEL
ncbi:DUF3047 domain-containing protein [Omnitrophica bacterium]|nr:DUF3047 domain-containing protein [Candidatus Omnitrophota bacterium]